MTHGLQNQKNAHLHPFFLKVLGVFSIIPRAGQEVLWLVSPPGPREAQLVLSNLLRGQAKIKIGKEVKTLNPCKAKDDKKKPFFG